MLFILTRPAQGPVDRGIVVIKSNSGPFGPAG